MQSRVANLTSSSRAGWELRSAPSGPRARRSRLRGVPYHAESTLSSQCSSAQALHPGRYSSTLVSPTFHLSRPAKRKCSMPKYEPKADLPALVATLQSPADSETRLSACETLLATPVSAALRTMRGMQRSSRPSLKRAITKYEQAIKREVHESRASRVDARAVRDDRPDWSMPTHDASARAGRAVAPARWLLRHMRTRSAMQAGKDLSRDDGEQIDRDARADRKIGRRRHDKESKGRRIDVVVEGEECSRREALGEGEQEGQRGGAAVAGLHSRKKTRGGRKRGEQHKEKKDCGRHARAPKPASIARWDSSVGGATR